VDAAPTIRRMADEPEKEAAADARTRALHASLLSTAVGNQCAFCHAPLTPDQRYCLECGERNGDSRFPATAAAAPQATAAWAPGQRRLRMPANATFIAGVGTLLLALGIGVLIGRSGDNAPAKSGAVQVVTVPSGGAATSTTASTAATATTGGAKHKKFAAKHAKTSTAAVPKAKKKLPPPVVKVGSPGHGAGYQHGKFTGNFFGP
jgi:hypothetical protein